MGLYPPGSQVRLSTGIRGIVTVAGEDLERPRLKLTHDVAGHAISGVDALLIDLSAEDSASLEITALVME